MTGTFESWKFIAQRYDGAPVISGPKSGLWLGLNSGLPFSFTVTPSAEFNCTTRVIGIKQVVFFSNWEGVSTFIFQSSKRTAMPDIVKNVFLCPSAGHSKYGAWPQFTITKTKL